MSRRRASRSRPCADGAEGRQGDGRARQRGGARLGQHRQGDGPERVPARSSTRRSRSTAPTGISQWTPLADMYAEPAHAAPRRRSRRGALARRRPRRARRGSRTAQPATTRRPSTCRARTTSRTASSPAPASERQPPLIARCRTGGGSVAGAAERDRAHSEQRVELVSATHPMR